MKKKNYQINEMRQLMRCDAVATITVLKLQIDQFSQSVINFLFSFGIEIKSVKSFVDVNLIEGNLKPK